MDNEEYNKIFELERNGKPEGAFQLLGSLDSLGHPMALIELSMRYYSNDGYVYPVFPVEPDIKKSKELEQKAKRKFEELAAANDGEAMRMLGYYYFCHWGLCDEKDTELGEEWLLKAFGANCFFAAKDLATLYQGSDIEKAKFYYQEAERHNCRVVQNDNLETNKPS